MEERDYQENQERQQQDSRGFQPMSEQNQDSPGREQNQQQELRVSAESDSTSERGGTSNRGFAAMDPERQRRIASEGGRAAHKQGVAHEWNRDEAREAGRKGGQIVSRDRQHMSEIGRKGGQRSGSKRSRNNNEQV